MLVPQMNRLSTDRPVLRRQLYRAYRIWLTGMGVYRPARILHRRKKHDFYRAWDFRFSDRQDPALAAMLLREAPLAMMAALGRACRDRRININVRMILARDYLAYRDEARQAVDFAKKWDRGVKKTRNKRLRIAKMLKPGLPRLKRRKKQEE